MHIIFVNVCALVIFNQNNFASCSYSSHLLWWRVYWREGGATWHSHEIDQ